MSRWPWITAIVAVVLAVNPVGQGFIHGAFLSNEQLSRNIARPIVIVAVLLLLAAGVLEWWVGMLLRRRRAGRDAAPLD
jgi:hypothetical protein